MTKDAQRAHAKNRIANFSITSAARRKAVDEGTAVSVRPASRRCHGPRSPIATGTGQGDRARPPEVIAYRSPKVIAIEWHRARGEPAGPKKMSPVRRALARHRALPTPIPIASGRLVVAQPEVPLPFSGLPQEAAALCALSTFVAEVTVGGSSP